MSSAFFLPFKLISFRIDQQINVWIIQKLNQKTEKILQHTINWQQIWTKETHKEVSIVVDRQKEREEEKIKNNISSGKTEIRMEEHHLLFFKFFIFLKNLLATCNNLTLK